MNTVKMRLRQCAAGVFVFCMILAALPVTTKAQETSQTQTFTLELKGNGANGSQTIPNQTTGTISLPENPFSRSNHIFIGWNTESDGSGTSYEAGATTQILPQDLTGSAGNYTYTLYAQWEPLQIVLRFDPNAPDSTGSMEDIPLLYTESTPIPQNAYTRTGYVFSNWNTKADGTGHYVSAGSTSAARYLTDYTEPTEQHQVVPLYAIWQPIRYSVKLDYNVKGGTGYRSLSLSYDEETTLPDASSFRPGYRLRAWTSNPDGSGASYGNEAVVKNLSAVQGDTVTLYAQWESIFQNPDAIQIYYRSQSQIKSFASSHPVKNLSASYVTQPSASSPYAAGKLTNAVQQDALNALNIIRYSAGLNAGVVIDASYAEMAQAAALVNAANRQLSHYPSQPSGMSDSLYELGKTGAGSSNLASAWGYTPSLASRVYEGWLSDGDSSNIDRVGHRRWVLNPTMNATGFGQVGGYYAMYAFGRAGTYNGEVSIWPSQNTPLEYFGKDYPWSYSSGRSETMSNIRVRVTKVGTGSSWNFSSASSDGYFNVDNAGYGLSGCVIFRPNNLTVNSQDEFRVTITGLTEGDVSYTVRFFSLKEGWKKSNGKWMYQDSGGSTVANAWRKIEGKWYYFDGSGYMQTGWVKVSGKWYYMDSSGAMMTGWQKVGGKWYYLQSSGAMATGWQKVGGTWYYLKPGNGAMQTGWVKDGGKWYYLKSSGAMATGWLKDGGKWYYLKSSGAMATGWVKAGNKWYYMNGSGAMQTGWIKSGGKWYYLESSGAMLANTSRTIGGKTYNFNASGACTNP